MQTSRDDTSRDISLQAENEIQLRFVGETNNAGVCSGFEELSFAATEWLGAEPTPITRISAR
jgi:hypothetical protein